MNQKMAPTFAVLVLLAVPAGAALSPTFSYQGRLSDGGVPATGTYDLQFKLYDTSGIGTGALLGTQSLEDVSVTGGLFTVQLDFGNPPPLDGNDRWIEIGVRPFNSTGPFTTLAPRQMLTPTPYSFYAPNAGTAATAASAAGFSGTLAGEVTGPQNATVVTNAVSTNTVN